MNTKFYSVLIALVSYLFLAACAPEDSPEVERPADTEAAPAEETAETATVTEEDGVLVVEITVDDTMTFQQERFEVSAGQEVRLVLEHVGNLPAEAMGHNLVILEQGVDTMEFAMAAARAAGNDYVPEDREDEVVAATEVIGGGETTEITFTAPEEEGEYDYICSFPGHTAAGMVGIMAVQ